MNNNPQNNPIQQPGGRDYTPPPRTNQPSSNFQNNQQANGFQNHPPQNQQPQQNTQTNNQVNQQNTITQQATQINSNIPNVAVNSLVQQTQQNQNINNNQQNASNVTYQAVSQTYEPVTGGVFKRSSLLMKQSLKALQFDKSILSVQIIGVALMLPLLLIAAGIAIGGFLLSSDETIANIISFVTGLVLYILFTIYNTYLMVAISYGALRIFDGNHISASECFKAANARLGAISSFGIISGSLGFALSTLEKKSSIWGNIVIKLIGLAWSVATMFVAPLIASQEKPKGGLSPIKESAMIFKRVWGESIVAGIGIGAISALIIIVTALIGALSIFLFTTALGVVGGVVGIALTVIALILVALIFASLQAIINSALFYYAKNGRAPAMFNPELLKSLIKPGSRRGRFSSKG